MDFLFINAKFDGKVELTKEALNYCKKYKILALYSSIQFSTQLDKILKQLEKEKITVITSQPARTNGKYQILGCDLSYENLKLEKKPDAFLYIGDGIFHPRALVLAQKDESEFKEVITFDPISKQLSSLGLKNVKKILKSYKGSLLKFLHSENVGVLITLKPGQQQFNPSKLLKEKYPNKTFYYFVDNNIDFSKAEDFPFIESWINTACPRLGFDDAAHISLPVLNLTDALNLDKLLEKKSFLTEA